MVTSASGRSMLFWMTPVVWGHRPVRMDERQGEQTLLRDELATPLADAVRPLLDLRHCHGDLVQFALLRVVERHEDVQLDDVRRVVVRV